ncbi:hypothetical protein [Vibrio coralliilyticus]|uniref:hypothetical protein n=1 Tax=Vibrio coralliilyticus TaxID=190893 RepID=UPI001560FE24|nr:hypothetical protein [Vibrio coralliilyticus]NRF13838.1 hypothetical protein [Vibrio coralliilyticus]NRF62257.1 hypothetical protein [Vibrio coralliilyticus]
MFHKDVIIALLALLLTACSNYSYVTVEDSSTQLSVKLPKASIVSPSQYDYYPYIFRELDVFEDISEGYTNKGLEIRVQRSSAPKNRGVTFTSLIISAATFFVVPSVGQFQETLDFSVYEDGKLIDSYNYSATKYITVWLFNSPNSLDESTISKKMDTEISKQFTQALYNDYKEEGGKKPIQ